MQNAVASVNWRRIVTLAGIVALIVFALWLASHIPRTITIFVIAAFIASAVHPIVARMERGRLPRVWAITLVYLILILLVVFCAVVVLPLTFAQTQVLAGNIPGYLQVAQGWLLHFADALRARFPGASLPPQLTNIQQVGTQRVSDILNAALLSLGALAINLATGLFIAFSAMILSFFFLLNHRQIADGFSGMFPASRRATARVLATEIVQVFGGFISGQIIVSAITGAAIAAVTGLLGFKFALLLGLISAIAYAIPIVGMLAAQLLALVIAAPQGLGTVIMVQVTMFVVARISDNVLVPKIMGESVGVSPIGVMFAVFAGGELFGLPGLILGIPAAALIKLLWRYFVVPAIAPQPAPAPSIAVR